MFFGNCLICSQHLEDNNIFCRECSKFALELSRKCIKCGGFTIMSGQYGCNLCNGRKVWFDSLYSPYLYCGAISSVISLMKYGRNRSYAAILGEHLASILYSEKTTGKTVVYPPMSFIDKFRRSFNQSEIIAEKVAMKHNLKINGNLIKKVKRTKPQASLTYDKRIENLKGAFRLNGQVKGVDFLIIDDVCTTFSTINSIAELLKKNGAKTVCAITIARTSLYFG